MLTSFSAIRIWSRYLDFIEKQAETIAKSLEITPQQFLDLGFKKAISATQYHISEVAQQHCSL